MSYVTGRLLNVPNVNDIQKQINELKEKDIELFNLANGIRSDLQIEIQNRIADVERLLLQLSNESEIRAQKDEEINLRISAEVARLTETINALQLELTEAINNEAATRQAKDDDLQSQIDTEITNRQEADGDLQGQLNTEIAARQEVDSDLQSQINAIESKADVVDVVATKADLDNYDTSTLTDKDVIKVLADESQGDATTYYRWVITNDVGAWTFIGAVGPYVTLHGDQTIDGNKSFTRPVEAAHIYGLSEPTADNEAANKKYVDKNIIDKISLLNDQSQIRGGTYPRLLKYNDNKLYLFLDNRYRVSTDKGKTWGEPIILFTESTEVQESGRAINDVGNAYAFLSPNNDGRIVVLYRSLNRDTSFFSICAKVSDTNGENFGARQELFNSTSGYWEPFYYKRWIYYSSEHDGSGSDKAQSIYRRTLSIDLNGVISVGSGTRFLDGRNKVDTDGNVNNKTRLDMISASPVENGHIFVFESSVNINASMPRPLVVQYCYSQHPENNPAQPTSVVSLFLGSSGKKCGAPFVTTLDDGRIVISFQTNEYYKGVSRSDFRDNQFVVFVSKRKVTYNDSLTADDFVKLTTYEYAENEYGVWGSVSNIDGILYKAFNIGVNKSTNTNTAYGNLVQKCLLSSDVPEKYATKQYVDAIISGTTSFSKIKIGNTELNETQLQKVLALLNTLEAKDAE